MNRFGLVVFLATEFLISTTSGLAIPEAKIAHAYEASKGEFPMAAQLHILQNGSSVKCGASILTSELLVTAAHCTTGLSNLHISSGNEITVVAGEVIWKMDLKWAVSLHYLRANPRRTRQMPQTRKVINVIVHEDYRWWTLENDLAILILDKGLEFDSYVQPVNLPDQDQIFNGTAIICGWGNVAKFDREYHDLRMAAVPILNISSCMSVLGNTNTTIKYNDQNMICAGGNGSDTCKGDSGGPLLCTSDSKQYLCGIASWGRGCGVVGVPSAYTRVSSHTNWIRNVIQEYKTANCSEQFDCENGRCVPASKVCNGVNECGNGRDETDCGTCFSEEFLCSTKRGKCIPHRNVCNGYDDCGDGSDELGCGRCNITEFECQGSNGQFCVSTFCSKIDYFIGGCYNSQCQAKMATLDSNKLWHCDNYTNLTCTKSVNEVCVLGHRECETEFTEEPTEFNIRSNCASGEFDCRNGRCYQNSSLCNGVNECGNWLDEVGCGSCAGNQFQCANSTIGTVPRCISLGWVCDGDNDCLNGSDEMGCNGTTKPCSLNQFRCDSGACIAGTKLCDNRDDCLDRSDESNSTCWSTLCGPTSFKCGTGQCIPNTNICDGDYDCIDGSDENPIMCAEYKPIIIMDSIDDGAIAVAEGSNVELVCQTKLVTTRHHIALPFMYWMYDYYAIQDYTRLNLERRSFMFSLTLTIPNATLKDSGRYECVVSQNLQNNASVVVAVSNSKPCHGLPTSTSTSVPSASDWNLGNTIMTVSIILANLLLLAICLAVAWKFWNKLAEMSPPTANNVPTATDVDNGKISP